MNNPNENSKANKVGYAMGQFLGKTIVGCTIAIVIALTIKIISWLLF